MDKSEVLNIFHPRVKEWFLNNIGVPSPPQVEGWPQIRSGKNVLISAPTGSGKTLAAFLESINRLLVMGLNNELPDGVFILYVSPLKALNNDINKNLEIPLQGIRRLFAEKGEDFPDIRKAVRTGDTSQYERAQILKKPPHILITTPESLFLMLTSIKAREILENVHYMIIDEIHTLLGTKRGVHLAVSMERVEELAQRKIIRIGLSATVNPLDAAARYLGGLYRTGNDFSERPVEIIAPDIERGKELKIHVPVEDYRVLEQGSVWPDIYTSLVKLIREHRSTLVFENDRATAERVAANVNAIADEELCRPHHGSISRNRRLETEERFKAGKLRCIIATSTLELGIDVGSVDFIVQVSAPPAVSAGLQRLGRAGHRLSAVSKGVIIPKTRVDLVKSCFIAKEMLDARIEKERIPENCLDILAQHIVSKCCTGKWHENDLYSLVRQAYSYRNLREDDFRKVLAMLAGDYEHNKDIPAKPRILWDRQNKTVIGSDYSKMLALSGSGTIPDRGMFPVYLEDYRTRVGELDEEFVFESRIGDKFMLGSTPWRITGIDRNRIIVAPTTAIGATAPFWKGDGIGMPFEQAVAYGKFLRDVVEQIEDGTFIENAVNSSLLDEKGALNIKNYLMDQADATGVISNDRRVVVEYTSAKENDNKIIIHAHFGGRVNSVLSILFQEALDIITGCKAYTSHTNDAVLIHLYGYVDGLSDIFSLISSENVEQVLINALPRTSRFALTFQYNAYRALMMGIRKHGQRLPLWVQRLRSVDALENAQKYIDHPLIVETMRECLDEVFDIPDAIRVLKDIEQGRIQVVEKKTWFPSPFASEILFRFEQEFLYMEKAPHPGQNEYPAISGIESLNLSYRAEKPGVLLRDEAVAEVVKKNNAEWRLEQVKSADELHSFLLIYGDTPISVFTGRYAEWLAELENQNRVAVIPSPVQRVIAAEETGLYSAAEKYDFPVSTVPLISRDDGTWTEEEVITRILRRFARYNSPFDREELMERYPFTGQMIEKILSRLSADGTIVYSGQYKKYFLTAIYDRATRLTLNIAVDEIRARNSSELACLLYERQINTAKGAVEEERLYEAVTRLEGLYLPADAWENIVFPARINRYTPGLLDKLCSSGRIVWRIKPGEGRNQFKLAWFRTESIDFGFEAGEKTPDLSEREREIYTLLQKRGSAFTHVLTSLSGMVAGELLDVLKELVLKGLVVNDSFAPLRFFLNKEAYDALSPVQKARKIAAMVSEMKMGRWEPAYPPKQLSIQEFIRLCGLRCGIFSKEITELEDSPFTWPEVYEKLKQMEYAGEIQRGYFFTGISGIQFMLPDEPEKTDAEKPDYFVLNAYDPAQPYGRIIPHSGQELPFTCTPGTAIVFYRGKPVMLVERYGGKITFDPDIAGLYEPIHEFKNAFQEKRIWPDRKRIAVKYWPEDPEQKQKLKSALAEAGFIPEIDKMVLWRTVS
ncbi:MAG: DEAD/DEAH box helicase [Clostridiaceae bacterium]|nr:DEAD/DEAH box helicase [Clostridiaceae bacterium]